jgi:hypothetical protein
MRSASAPKGKTKTAASGQEAGATGAATTRRSGLTGGAQTGQRSAPVGRLGDPRVRGAAPSRAALRRRPPRFRFRLAGIDEIFADADARVDAHIEARRDQINRRTNWRTFGVLVLIAVGLGIIAAASLNEIVRMVLNIFES